MVFKGTLERYNRLTFILPHSGGAIPFIYPRWDMVYQLQAASHPLKKLPRPPSHYLRRHYYDTALSYVHSSLACTLALAGIDHVVFGTDVPYVYGELLGDSVRYIETYGFSNEAREKIFWRNLAEIFPGLKKRIEGPA
jgi:predicted TIM-barrel fold metal-dependent hydrolase